MNARPYNRSGRSSGKRVNRFRSKKNGRYGRSKGRTDHSRYINKNPTEQVVKEYEATTTIETLSINETLRKNILQKGFTTLTPIQDQSITQILDGKDLIGVAETGTGKTAAFLIPAINKSHADKSEKFLIIAPTRELAQQINTEFRSFSKGLNLYSTLCIGGTSMYKQKKDLSRPHSFLICTPGRIKDLAERRWVDLSKYNNVIIDEVDRMFDMGFQKDIQTILSQLPQQKQVLFFSATVSDGIERLINKYLTNPHKVSISKKDSSANIMQDIVKIDRSTKKIDVLHDMLIKPEFTKVLVFIKTKWSLTQTERELKDRGFKVTSIHGNKTQSARQRSLAMFKEDRTKVLLATDVAARGLDIDDISHVINFDQPATHDDYIHRIGRTGRGNKRGVALTFV